jgi:hypothetical protein
MLKNKLIENMDHKVWTEFAAKCRIDGVKIRDRITDMIKHDLKRGDKHET